MTVMTYVEIAPVDREGALRELDSGDEERVIDALLGLSLHDDIMFGWKGSSFSTSLLEALFWMTLRSNLSRKNSRN